MSFHEIIPDVIEASGSLSPKMQKNHDLGLFSWASIVLHKFLLFKYGIHSVITAGAWHGF